AEEPVLDLALIDEVVDGLLCVVDRNGEAQADAAARGRGDPGVDPDHFASDVHKRAARVALVDGGIGLYIVRVGRHIPAGRPGTAESAHDAHGDRVLEPEGVAHGQHQVTHLQRARVPQVRHGKVVVAGERHDCEV